MVERGDRLTLGVGGERRWWVGGNDGVVSYGGDRGSGDSSGVSVDGVIETGKSKR